MRLPKPSIPPPITFIMFFLSWSQISKIIPQKMDAAGGGGKEKQTFFSPTCHSASQERASLETQVDQHITIDCLHYFQEKKKYQHDQKRYDLYRSGTQNKSLLERDLKKIKTASPALCWKMSCLRLKIQVTKTKLDVTPTE